MEHPARMVNVGGVRWCDLPPELLANVFSRLDVVGFVRAHAVCVPWGRVPARTRPHIPWLIASTSAHPSSLYFYALRCLHGGEHHRKSKKYEIAFPQIADRRIVGLSQGFIITVDKATSAAIDGTNPLTGAHFPFPAAKPDILTLVDDMFRDPALSVSLNSQGTTVQYIKENVVNNKIEFAYRRVVISPSLKMVAAVVECMFRTSQNQPFWVKRLLLGPAGGDSWTDLNSHLYESSDMPFMVNWMDILFHQDRLYAITFGGELVIFDMNLPASLLLVVNDVWHVVSGAFLVESPDGNDLFLLPEKNKFFKEVKVFKMDDSSHKFEQTRDLGEIVIFMSSMSEGTSVSSLSTCKLSILMKNCVYFACVWGRRLVGVYSLEDGSTKPLGCNDVLGEVCKWSPVWFTPAVDHA